MKFFEYLFQGLQNFSVYHQNADTSTNTTEFQVPSNFVKNPDKTVAIIQPTDFGDVVKFVDFISGNRSAVVDFNALCNNDLQRAVDFVSGAVCALHGEMQNISSGIYLFAPDCTKLVTNKRKKNKR